MALNDPVPSNAFDVLQKNMEVADEFANSTNFNATTRGAPNGKSTIRTIAGLEQDAKDAISNSVTVYIGVWTSGLTTFNSYNEYAVFNGLSYKPKTTTTLPYVAQGADPTVAPDVDFVEPFSDLNSDNISEFASKANYISNPQFQIYTPDQTQTPPSATPTDYNPGAQVFADWFADDSVGVTGLTFENCVVNATSGKIYTLIPNNSGLECTNDLSASWASTNLLPSTDGVSFAIDGDNYKVEVDLAIAANVFSVKFESGQAETLHEVDSGSEKYGWPINTSKIDVKFFGAVGDGVTDDGPAIQRAFDYAGSFGRDRTVRPRVVFSYGTFISNQTINVPYVALGCEVEFVNSVLEFTSSVPTIQETNENTLATYDTKIGIHCFAEQTRWFNPVIKFEDSEAYGVAECIRFEKITVGGNRLADVDAKIVGGTIGYCRTGIVCRGRGLTITQTNFAQMTNCIGIEAPLGDFTIPSNPASQYTTWSRRYYFSEIDSDGTPEAVLTNLNRTKWSQYVQGITADCSGGFACKRIWLGHLRNSTFANVVNQLRSDEYLFEFETATNININGNFVGNYDETLTPQVAQQWIRGIVKATGRVDQINVYGLNARICRDTPFRFEDECRDLSIIGCQINEYTSDTADGSEYAVVRFIGDAYRPTIIGNNFTSKTVTEAKDILLYKLGASLIGPTNIDGNICEGTPMIRQQRTEDGTFTPTVEIGGSVVASTGGGTYTRNGSSVSGFITLTMQASGSGAVVIKGLPVPGGSVAGSGQVGVATIQELTGGSGIGGVLKGRIQGTDITMTISTTSTYAETNLTGANISASSRIRLDFSYISDY